MSTRPRPAKSRGPARRPTLLVLDEDWSTLEHIYEGLRNEYELTLIERASETLEVMERKPFDVLLTNARISGMELPDLVSQVKARHPKVHYVLMSTFSEVEATMAAMRLGVADYVRKPFNIIELRHVLARSLERSHLHQELDGLRSGPPSTLEGIIAHDERMREVCRLAETVAATDATVLLSGETGTGKGLFAQGHPQQLAAPRRALCGDQLRGHPRHPHRERAVRPRAGSLHRGGGPQDRPGGGRGQGHPAPGRGGGDAPGHAGQDAALFAGVHLRAGGGQRKAHAPTCASSRPATATWARR